MFFKKKEPSLGDLGYPTPADAMPDEWVASAEELEQALRELGVTATVEARHNGTPGSDLLVVFFSFFHLLVDRDGDRWVFGLPNPRGGAEKQWFDDLNGFKNIPARMVAIQVVARALVFIFSFLDSIGNLPQSQKDKFGVDQNLIAELFRASSSAALPGHWLEVDANTTEEEDWYLSIFGQTAQKMVEFNLQKLGLDISGA